METIVNKQKLKISSLQERIFDLLKEKSNQEKLLENEMKILSINKENEEKE